MEVVMERAGSTDPSNPSHPMFATSRISRTNNGGASVVGSTSHSHHGGHSVPSGGHGGHVGSAHLERAPGFSSTRAAALANLTGAVSISSDPQSNRRDFLNYALSLMRAHNAEHSDSLPVIDVSAMKHIAYVFDALIYYMRSGTEAIEDANSAMTATAINISQGAPTVSVLRTSSGGIAVTTGVPAPTGASSTVAAPPVSTSAGSVSNIDSYGLNVVYADENEPEDPNDDSLLEDNSQPGTTQSVDGSAQPMELDYDEDNTNQSVASNLGLQPSIVPLSSTNTASG